MRECIGTVHRKGISLNFYRGSIDLSSTKRLSFSVETCMKFYLTFGQSSRLIKGAFELTCFTLRGREYVCTYCTYIEFMYHQIGPPCMYCTYE